MSLIVYNWSRKTIGGRTKLADARINRRHQIAIRGRTGTQCSALLAQAQVCGDLQDFPLIGTVGIGRSMIPHGLADIWPLVNRQGWGHWLATGRMPFVRVTRVSQRPLAESKSVFLKRFWRNRPAKRIGLYVTVGHIARVILPAAPPMPPAGFDEVASLHHLEFELAITLVFCAALVKLLVAFRLENIFDHSGQ